MSSSQHKESPIRAQHYKHINYTAITINSGKYPHIFLPLPVGVLAINAGSLSSEVQPWNCTLCMCSFWHKSCILSYRLVSSFFLCRKLKVLLFYRSLSGMIKLASKEWHNWKKTNWYFLTMPKNLCFINNNWWAHHHAQPELHQPNFKKKHVYITLCLKDRRHTFRKNTFSQSASFP